MQITWCQMAETEEKLLRKLRQWKDGFEAKGLKVNVGKTKVMRNVDGTDSLKDAGKYPCSVCRKGVGRNSILCSRCKLWLHKRCSGMKGQLKMRAVLSVLSVRMQLWSQQGRTVCS